MNQRPIYRAISILLLPPGFVLENQPPALSSKMTHKNSIAQQSNKHKNPMCQGYARVCDVLAQDVNWAENVGDHEENP